MKKPGFVQLGVLLATFASFLIAGISPLILPEKNVGNGSNTINTLNSGNGKVKITGADTTANYLGSKLVAGTNISFVTNNAGANETLTISASGAGTPAGSSNEIQINNAGAFGAITLGTANQLLGMNTGGTANEYKTVSNGLTSSAGAVKLGGALTADTTIDGGSAFDFSLTNLDAYTLSGSALNLVGSSVVITGVGSTTVQSVGSLRIATPAVIATTASAGQFLKLVNATTGDAEWDTVASGSGTVTSITAGTGITLSTNPCIATCTVTSNLSTGIAGGQAVIGGTASGESLTLTSTTNATKGDIILASRHTFNQATNFLGLGIAPTAKLHVADATSTSVRGIVNDQYSTDTGSARFFTRKARGSTATPTTIVTGDNLGSWMTSGHDGTSFVDSARILIASTGTISTGIVPSTMSLQTMNAAGTLTTGLSLSSAQILSLPLYTTNGGLLYTNGSGVVSQTGAGTATTVLHGGTTPSYSAVSLTADVTGTLPVANGGTNATSWTAGSIIFAGASGTSLAQDNTSWFYNDSTDTANLGSQTPTQGRFNVTALSTTTPGINIRGAASMAGETFNIENSAGTDQFQTYTSGTSFTGLSFGSSVNNPSLANILRVRSDQNAISNGVLANTTANTGAAAAWTLATSATSDGKMQLNSATNTTFGGTSSLNLININSANLSLGTANTSWMFLTSDGRFYGTALHNNAGAVTGTTTQYIASGTYTPTLTNVANLDASTSYLAQWTRVGNVVTVSGKADVDPTTTLTSTQLGISLPIASNIANAQNSAGTAHANAIAGQGAAILGDATNDRSQMEWITADITNQSMYYTFTYTVL